MTRASRDTTVDDYDAYHLEAIFQVTTEWKVDCIEYTFLVDCMFDLLQVNYLQRKSTDLLQSSLQPDTITSRALSQI